MRRNSVAVIVGALLAGSVTLRLLHLGWMPGVDGDEGWWAVQARRSCGTRSRADAWIRARGRHATRTSIHDQGGRDLLEVLDASASR